MDRATKAMLLLTALSIASYLAWLIYDCTPERGCHWKFCGPRGAPCGIVRG